jgi:membrane-bound serine protease (ClpP class)
MGVFVAIVVNLAFRSHKQEVVSGKEGLIGKVGRAETDLNPEGEIFIHGEHWIAELIQPDTNSSENITVSKGENVIVKNVVGLKLLVMKNTPITLK